MCMCRHPGVLRLDAARRVEERAAEDDGDAADRRQVGTDAHHRRHRAATYHPTD